MPDLAALAQRLKQVREAQQRFLALWAVECLLDRPQANQRLQNDLAACGSASGEGDSRSGTEHRSNTPNN